LLTGALDAQWVEITGVVRRYFAPTTNSPIWRIQLAADGGVVSIRGDSRRGAEVKEDAVVRVQAVCLYQFNQKRQVLTPVLQVPSGMSVTVVQPAPADPFAAPLRAANSLLQFSPTAPSGHRIHVRGVVTHAQPGSFVWIRDHSAGLRVQVPQQEKLRVGDEVDVLGFPAYGYYAPMLEDAILRQTGSNQPPGPMILTNATAAYDHEDDLVELQALLTEVQPVLDGVAFTFDSDGTVFKAMLQGRVADLPAEWQPGGKMRVTGICTIIHDDVRPIAGVWQPRSFQLLLRSPADLAVLQTPSWWNSQHLSYVLGAALAAVLLVTGIIMLLARRRLNEQAHRRAMAEAEFAAILTERNRLAREIHDTLAQGLAATSVQLRLAKKQATGDPESLQHHLDVAQQLVGESLEEARNSIWNMRSQVLETGDLASALNGILKQMADGTGLETQCEINGRARRLSPVIENNLLRVGQEAITNATRHAAAGLIKVTLDFDDKQFRLVVQDNGRGFDPAQPPTSNGGFGLVGMRERATELNGELLVNSTPGGGTRISLNVPLTGE
jgi:signal transduction histidine kinase